MDYVTFLEYNNWANNRLLDIAEQLPEAQLHSGKLSRGSAFETLHHMLDAEWSWRVICQNVPPGDPPWTVEALNHLPGLRAYWKEENERLLTFVQTLSEADLEHEAFAFWREQQVKIKYALLHIVNHASNHRCEVGWYFTDLGHSPGDLEFVDYLLEQSK